MYTTTFTDVPLEGLLERVQTLRHEGTRFVQLCAETDPDDKIDLLYTFYDEVRDEALNLVVADVRGREVPSIQGLYFTAFSYENETHDLFGVHFANMKLDFGGHFFNVATTEPMTIISPEMKKEREKAAKLKAAAAAKAAKAAAAAREKAEAEAAAKALEQSPAEADAAESAKLAGAPTPVILSEASEGREAEGSQPGSNALGGKREDPSTPAATAASAQDDARAASAAKPASAQDDVRAASAVKTASAQDDASESVPAPPVIPTADPSPVILSEASEGREVEGSLPEPAVPVPAKEAR